jgi:hypothetical protein
MTKILIIKKLAFFLLMFLSLLLVTLAILNWQSSSIGVFGLSNLMPSGLLTLITLLIGMGTGLLIPSLLDKSAINEQKKLDWQAQDSKLMATVASDREKQLEAKIATLETALKTVLKTRQ